MRCVILFTDNPDADPSIRPRHMAAHLAYLAANGDRILQAGPLRDGEAGAGALWVVEIDGPEDARALVEGDPFWPTGLRASWRVLGWKIVHGG